MAWKSAAIDRLSVGYMMPVASSVRHVDDFELADNQLVSGSSRAFLPAPLCRRLHCTARTSLAKLAPEATLGGRQTAAKHRGRRGLCCRASLHRRATPAFHSHWIADPEVQTKQSCERNEEHKNLFSSSTLWLAVVPRIKSPGLVKTKIFYHNIDKTAHSSSYAV